MIEQEKLFETVLGASETVPITERQLELSIKSFIKWVLENQSNAESSTKSAAVLMTAALIFGQQAFATPLQTGQEQAQEAMKALYANVVRAIEQKHNKTLVKCFSPYKE